MLLRSVKRHERLALSVQCLTEFYRVSTRRIPTPLSNGEAAGYIADFIQSAQVHPLTLDAVLEATRLASERSISIWDALIWAVAKLNDISIILTEDVPAPEIDGVAYANPFAPDFEAARYGIELAS